MLLTSSGTALTQLQQSLQEVKDLCQLPDDEDTEEDESDGVEWREKLDGVTKGLGVPFATDKLNKVKSLCDVFGFLCTQLGIKVNLIFMYIHEGQLLLAFAY